MTQRRIPFDFDTLFSAELQDLALVDQGVELDLVDKWHFGGVLRKVAQMGRAEVAHADPQGFSLFFEAAQDLPRLEPVARVVGMLVVVGVGNVDDGPVYEVSVFSVVFGDFKWE